MANDFAMGTAKRNPQSVINAVANIAAKTKRSPDQARQELAASNPMGRLITPEEVAAAVGFLCLPSAATITGAALPIAAGEVG